jgi:DNA polymerase-3 subunit delta'
VSDPGSDVVDSRRGASGAALLPWQVAWAASVLARRERWPHAALITGPAGIGKRALADWLARVLLCETPRADGAPCNACPGCHYIGAGQHPDLRILDAFERSDDDVKAVEWIVVDRIRALLQWAELTSHRGGAKVALIDPAERMNAAAANALLKTLEEPPPNTHFLLVSQQPNRLPATIISRCQRMAAPLPDTGIARQWLADRGIADAERVLAQAHGAPLAADALANVEYQHERRAWLTALSSPRTLPVTSLGARVDAGPREGRRERLAAVVDWLVAWCADLARARAGGAPRANADFGAQLNGLASSVAALPLFRYHRRLLQQRALLAHPLQPRLVAEALLIDYRALFG